MRYPIWKKTDFFHPLGGDHLDMDAADMHILKDRIPVSAGFSFSALPIAIATDFVLEDGEVTAEITWDKDNYDNLVEEELMRFGPYVTSVIKDDIAKRVTSCELKGVGFYPVQDCPGYKNPGAHV